MTDTSNAAGVVPPDWSLQRNQAQEAYNNAMASLHAQHQSLLDQYGFSYTTNPDGSVAIGNLDPSKQFGAVQQLIGQQGNTLLQDHRAELARGIGAGGLAAQNAGNLRIADSAQRAQQAAGLQNSTHGITDQENAAQQGLNSALTGIDQNQANWNLAYQEANPPQPTPTTGVDPTVAAILKALGLGPDGQPVSTPGTPGYQQKGFRSPVTYTHKGATGIPGL